MRKSRVIDPDLGTSADPTFKKAVYTDSDTLQNRNERRQSLKDDDKAMSSNTRYSTNHVDSQRYMPRETNAPLGHPRKARRLPGHDQERGTFSARQRRERYAAAREAASVTPRSEVRETGLVLNEGSRWQAINDQLSKLNRPGSDGGSHSWEG